MRYKTIKGGQSNRTEILFCLLDERNHFDSMILQKTGKFRNVIDQNF